MTLEGIGLVVIGGHMIFIWRERSVEVEYIVHLYVIIIIACVVLYWYSYLSRVYLPASNIPVSSLRVLEAEEPQ